MTLDVSITHKTLHKNTYQAWTKLLHANFYASEFDTPEKRRNKIGNLKQMGYSVKSEMEEKQAEFDKQLYDAWTWLLGQHFYQWMFIFKASRADRIEQLKEAGYNPLDRDGNLIFLGSEQVPEEVVKPEGYLKHPALIKLQVYTIKRNNAQDWVRRSKANRKKKNDKK